jgi:hypothetical protein
MVQDVSDQMFQIFSQRMRTELEGGAPEGASAPAPAPGAARAPAPAPEALDLGSLGARVAGRAALRGLRTPVPLWVVLLALLALVLLLR